MNTVCPYSNPNSFRPAGAASFDIAQVQHAHRRARAHGPPENRDSLRYNLQNSQTAGQPDKPRCSRGPCDAADTGNPSRVQALVFGNKSCAEYGWRNPIWTSFDGKPGNHGGFRTSHPAGHCQGQRTGDYCPVPDRRPARRAAGAIRRSLAPGCQRPAGRIRPASADGQRPVPPQAGNRRLSRGGRPAPLQ